jgi:hypothetical protein
MTAQILLQRKYETSSLSRSDLNWYDLHRVERSTAGGKSESSFCQDLTDLNALNFSCLATVGGVF